MTSGQESCAGRSDWETGDGVGSRPVLEIKRCKEDGRSNSTLKAAPRG